MVNKRMHTGRSAKTSERIAHTVYREMRVSFTVSCDPKVNSYNVYVRVIQEFRSGWRFKKRFNQEVSESSGSGIKKHPVLQFK